MIPSNSSADPETHIAVAEAPADRRREPALPRLERGGLRILSIPDLSPEQREAARRHFVRSVFPALTPLAVDPRHPFPHLRTPSLNVAVSLHWKEAPLRRAARPLLAVVQVPSLLPRLVRLPAASGEAYALLEDVVAASAAELFPGHRVGETAVFHLAVPANGHAGSEEGAPGRTARLELSADASPELEAALAAALKLGAGSAKRTPRPLQLADLVSLDDLAPDPPPPHG